MNKIIEMMMQQKLQQIPNGMMKQMEQQLKRINPQAYKTYQQARKENKDPNEFLNETVNGFEPRKKQEWNNMMAQFK